MYRNIPMLSLHPCKTPARAPQNPIETHKSCDDDCTVWVSYMGTSPANKLTCPPLSVTHYT
ncbi:uncharacterized protein PgNI_11557 [Pyricularia grisea]|uniref:Uncharacterized protein n=1 Tax=Pyricularia grisea TaxID=148305 RepID=A0A6P8ANU7_PYRGI|nr:uncharacterized protein PgNI_11557 [Pyricularia grisea]TLD03703.1 hypothetical protein PgNI_11557 [Pyricularia grisea]